MAKKVAKKRAEVRKTGMETVRTMGALSMIALALSTPDISTEQQIIVGLSIALGLLILVVLIPWLQGRVHIMPKGKMGRGDKKRATRVDDVELAEKQFQQAWELGQTQQGGPGPGTLGKVLGVPVPDVVGPIFGDEDIEDRLKSIDRKLDILLTRTEQIMIELGQREELGE